LPAKNFLFRAPRREALENPTKQRDRQQPKKIAARVPKNVQHLPASEGNDEPVEYNTLRLMRQGKCCLTIAGTRRLDFCFKVA